MPANREIDPALYRTAGYRVCGERAVRVDILERLADLIRPALSWREGSGSKPPGAIAGGGFTVVNGMTSLTGASGEDFASILRSLGYRMERRPKPPEPVTPVTETAAEPSSVAPTLEVATTTDGEVDATTPTDAEAPAEGIDQIVAPAIAAAESAMTEEAPAVQAETTAPDLEPSAPPATEIPAEPQPNEAAGSAPAIEAAADGAPAAATRAESATEPVMIEVWRPGRAEGTHRPRQKHRDRRRPKHADAASAPRAGEPALAGAPTGETAALPPAEQTQPAGAGAVAPKQDRHPRHRRRHAGEHRPDRPQRDRDRPQRERDRPPVKRFERREKAPDPNSPFAKLAALKAQLEADAKERR
jgi:ATP-dependent RNA helicase SUPV3L1/SUV3